MSIYAGRPARSELLHIIFKKNHTSKFISRCQQFDYKTEKGNSFFIG